MEPTPTEPEKQVTEPEAPKILAQLPDKYKADPELVELAKENNWGPIIDEFKRRGDELGKVPKAPEKIEEYKLDGSGVFENAEAKTAFLTLAHEAGLTQGQIEKFSPFANNLVLAALGENKKAKDKQYKDAEAELKEDWGDKFDTNIKIVSRAVEHLGGAELAQHFVGLGIDNDPVIVKMMHQVGTLIAEDSLVDGKVKGKEKKPTPFLAYKSMEQ